MKYLGYFLLPIVAASLTGCEWMPGRPKLADKRPEPHHITSFETLFNQNCRGCHGAGDNVSAVIPLDDPFYLQFLTKERLHEVITYGIKGTPMPAQALSQGGSLTDHQVEILVDGIMAWSTKQKPADFPPYSAPLGNAVQGAATFGVSCGSCHGQDGKGIAGKAGSVINHAYLGLVTDQYLRTIVLAGRSDLGCPTFQDRVPGRAMTNEEISDVVAWLASQRKNEFGQPLVVSQPAGASQPAAPSPSQPETLRSNEH